VATKSTNFFRRILSSIGLATDPYKSVMDWMLAPPITSPWNSEFWSDKPIDIKVETIDLCEALYGKLKDTEGIFGYDFDAVKGLISGLGTQCIVSYACYSFETKSGGESLPHWLNHGWWVRLGSDEMNELNDIVMAMPVS